jgi:hypothetical protein
MEASAPWERQRLAGFQRLGSVSALEASGTWEGQRIGSVSAVGASAPWDRQRLGSVSALGA